jgi:hypothetical protein
VDARRVNEIAVLLEGVPLPAKRQLLVEYARHEDAGVAELLRERLPDQEFDRLDAVAELLAGPPRSPRPSQRLPLPESGEPPGGDDYLQAFPEPGAVRSSAPFCCRRSFCGMTGYRGSAADWNPALKTDQRRPSSPARTSAPPVTAAARLRDPRAASNAAPAAVHALASRPYLPAAPCL